MEPVYNATILENSENMSDCILDDGDAFWSEADPIEASCVTFEFDMPRQQFQRFRKSPKEHFPEVQAAARKFGKNLCTTI